MLYANIVFFSKDNLMQGESVSMTSNTPDVTKT